MTSSKLLEVLSRDVATARAQGFKLALTISQTSGKTNSYLTPIRLCGDVAVTGVITDSTNEATEVAAALTAECQWLFVDVEKKLAPKRNGTEVDSRNFFNSIAEVVGYSQCVPIWPNRLTIDRILKEVTALLLRSRNLCVGIVGLGHLGSNIARELVNMGVRVVGCPKSISVREISLENSINLSKSSGTISDFKLVNSLEKLAIFSDVVLFCTDSIDVVNEENYSLFLRHILLCDVGKRNIAASTTQYLKQSRWLDVGESLVRYVMSHISLENEWKSLPILENPTHVLAGAIAKPGDVIFSTNRGEKYPIGAVQKSGDFKRFSFREIQTWKS